MLSNLFPSKVEVRNSNTNKVRNIAHNKDREAKYK